MHSIPCACKEKEFHVPACGSCSRGTHHYKDPLGKRTFANKLNRAKKLKPPKAKLKSSFSSPGSSPSKFSFIPSKKATGICLSRDSELQEMKEKFSAKKTNDYF